MPRKPTTVIDRFNALDSIAMRIRHGVSELTLSEAQRELVAARDLARELLDRMSEMRTAADVATSAWTPRQDEGEG